MTKGIVTTMRRHAHKVEMAERRKRQLFWQPSHQGDVANRVIRRGPDGLWGPAGKYNVKVTRGKR
jgi:hypothetical protein